MFEWLICAAGVATQAATEAHATVVEEASPDFLEFLADWDESQAVALDLDGPVPGDDEGRADGADRSSRPPSAGNGVEVLP